MTKSYRSGALVALGLAAAVPALAQTPGPNAAATVASLTHSVRVLPPEVSRSLKIARAPNSTTSILIGTYWACDSSGGHEFCWIKLVVCFDGQDVCIEYD
jgi:hypothetical protein